jgi:hypothetical protein
MNLVASGHFICHAAVYNAARAAHALRSDQFIPITHPPTPAQTSYRKMLKFSDHLFNSKLVSVFRLTYNNVPQSKKVYGP